MQIAYCTPTVDWCVQEDAERISPNFHICDVVLKHQYVRFTTACREPASQFPLNTVYICFRPHTSFIQKRCKLGSGSCRWYTSINIF